MNYIIVAFRSRTEAMYFLDTLKTYGGNGNIISTPKDAGVGCGVSVQIPENNLLLSRKILSTGKYKAYIALFSVENIYGKNNIRKLS